MAKIPKKWKDDLRIEREKGPGHTDIRTKAEFDWLFEQLSKEIVR